MSLSITSAATVAGRVIDAANHAGASSIDGPDFSFSDPTSGQVAAEKAAVADAQRQASATAAQLGDRITGVQSISLNPQSGGTVAPVASPSRSASAPSTPTTIDLGSQQVDATVAVVFTIAPVTATQ